MRDTQASGWMMRELPEAARRALRLAAVTFGVGLVMTVGVARAQDDNFFDRFFGHGECQNGICSAALVGPAFRPDNQAGMRWPSGPEASGVEAPEHADSSIGGFRAYMATEFRTGQRLKPD